MTHLEFSKRNPQRISARVVAARGPTRSGWRRLLLAALLFVGASRTVHAQDWLHWGGPNGDFTVESTRLAESWPKDGPPQLWKRSLGEGYASVLVMDERLYTNYSDGEDEINICLDARTGETIWQDRYARSFWEDMTLQFGAGPNATPLIVGERLISIGIAGQLRCLDLSSGKLLWELDLPAEFGRRKRIEEYGYSGIPLSYKGVVIVQVGGDNHSVVAFDPKNGKAVWKSAPAGISYAAPSIMNLAGRDQYIYFTPEGVVGLDPSTGTTLWQHEIEMSNGNHLTPVVKCDENNLFVASQFSSGGGRLLTIEPSPLGMTAKEQWFKRKLQESHWTSIALGDYIYGSIGGNRTSFVAAIEWRTGKLAWRKRGFHKAQCLYADGKLLFLDEQGKLALARVSPDGLTVLGSVQVTGDVSWTLPTLVGTNLYLRDRKNILALDLGVQPGT